MVWLGWRGWLRIFAVSLMLAAVALALVWSWWLAPARGLHDPDWLLLHSQEAAWREMKKAIGRGMWWHDLDCGFYMDGEGVALLMALAKPGETMDCLGPLSHADGPLRMATNQDLPAEWDAWLTWWEENADRPQEEWIREGFRQEGIVLEQPLSEENIRDLLVPSMRPHQSPQEQRCSGIC